MQERQMLGIVISSQSILTLLPYCCAVNTTGFHTGFKLLSITSVLHIGTTIPSSITLDILKKGSCTVKRKVENA